MSADEAPKKKAKPKPAKKKKLILKQANMLRVLYALVPVLLVAIYYFGWRVLAVVLVCQVTGFFTEFITAKKLRSAPVSTAAFVTTSLLGLALPPTIPYWIAAVGAVIAVLFGKEVFGGFGRNFANPAIVGRAFLYICFPKSMTGWFVPTYGGVPGGFGHWARWAPEMGPKIDCVTSATPMWAQQEGHQVILNRAEGLQPLVDFWHLFWGNIGGVEVKSGGTEVWLAAGSAGEVCAAVIILAGIYLIATKTANWRLTLSTLVGAVLANLFFRYGLGQSDVPPVWFTLGSGALMYAAVFMVTDPVSAPKKSQSMYVYGFLIGVFIVLIRWKSSFAGGVAFAILLGNLVGPLLDIGVQWWTDRKKARAEAEKQAREIPQAGVAPKAASGAAAAETGGKTAGDDTPGRDPIEGAEGQRYHGTESGGKPAGPAREETRDTDADEDEDGKEAGNGG